MDKYKIELWEGMLPPLVNLNKAEIISLKKKLCKYFSKPTDINCDDFYKNIYNFEIKIGYIDDGDLNQFFQHCDINFNMEDFVYLDWGNFEDIAKVKLHDFIINIDNFWYPSSDDLSIISQDCTWILNIHHDGEVGCVQFNTKN